MKRNKAFSFLTAAFLGASLSVIPGGLTAKAASGYCTVNNIRYYYDTETGQARISGYYGSGGALTIPSTVVIPSLNEEVSVTKISHGAFHNAPLTSVTIPASITYVDQEAFRHCTAMTSLTILGATEITPNSFTDCTALAHVQLSDSSWTSSRYTYPAFNNCPALYDVNGKQALQYVTDSSGVRKPVINPAIETAVRNHFSRSVNVGFVNDYCTDLCKYIVKTETDSDPDQPGSGWMNDALKARQLHDWLVRHCEYEDKLNGETNNDPENHMASSVFLSYAINVRGDGVGETVCDGFAKAYTMLLTTAGIESYHIGHSFHAWNLVKIDGKFYHVDVTNDNSYAGANPPQDKTHYTYFLKKSLHGGNIVQNHPTDHPLLMVYNNDVNDEIANCPETYSDANGDGILDYDFDLDGTAGGTDYWEDMLARQMLCGQQQWNFGYNTDINGKLSEVLYRLHQQHHGFWG